MFNNYIFDFYGTLAEVKRDSEQDFLWEKLSLLYACYGADYDSDTLKSTFFKYRTKMENPDDGSSEGVVDIEDVFFQLFKKKKIKPKNKMVKEAARMYLVLSTESIEFKPFMLEALKMLKDKKSNIYLYSSGYKFFLKNQLRILDIETLFEGYLTYGKDFGEDVEKGGMEMLINTYDITSKKTCVISSNSATIKVGNQLGMSTIYVANDTQEKEKKATHSVTNNKLIELLQK